MTPDEKIGYFVVREVEGMCELEVADTEAFDCREDALQWITTQGIVGVDYWVCAPVSSGPNRRLL